MYRKSHIKMQLSCHTHYRTPTSTHTLAIFQGTYDRKSTGNAMQQFSSKLFSSTCGSGRKTSNVELNQMACRPAKRAKSNRNLLKMNESLLPVKLHQSPRVLSMVYCLAYDISLGPSNQAQWKCENAFYSAVIKFSLTNTRITLTKSTWWQLAAVK